MCTYGPQRWKGSKKKEYDVLIKRNIIKIILHAVRYHDLISDAIGKRKIDRLTWLSESC
jgi:hypothetical protein